MTMPTPTECVCCQEITATADKTGTSELSTIRCITEHEGFDAVFGFCKPVTLTTDNTMEHVI